ncbi:MAG: hypothetical protein KC619_22135 [Myxococcales bacterium]|nr:hypothetical protein [Myxococcales bacterium]
MRAFALLAMLLSVPLPSAAQCADTPSTAPREVSIGGALRLIAPPRSAPSHGTAGMTGHWQLEVENLGDEWLTVELVDFTWGDEGSRASLRRAQLVFVGAGGRRHVGRRISLPPRYRGPLSIEGRGARVRYHVAAWHEVTLRAGGREATLAGCGLWFRFPHRRR